VNGQASAELLSHQSAAVKAETVTSRLGREAVLKNPRQVRCRNANAVVRYL
jgi:hypothetical protein